MLRPNSVHLEVFGQTWQFSRSAVKILRVVGMDSADKLKALVISLGSSAGIPDGDYRVNYYGMELEIKAKGNTIRVEDPYDY